MHLREIKRIDGKTFGLVQSVLVEKECFPLSSSSLRSGSFQVTFAVSDQKPKPSGQEFAQVSAPRVPGRPLWLHKMIFGGTWTEIYFYFHSHVFILVCIKICVASHETRVLMAVVKFLV